MTAIPHDLVRQTNDLIGKNDFTLGSFVFHENGLEAIGIPTFDDWRECGRFIFTTQRRLHFLIGDWLNIGELYYKEQYKQAAEKFGYTVQTLRQDKWVAGQIPRERRVPELSFDHHQSVAKLEPEEQEILLGEAVEENLPSNEFRKRVDEHEFGNVPQLKPSLHSSGIPDKNKSNNLVPLFEAIARLDYQISQVDFASLSEDERDKATGSLRDLDIKIGAILMTHRQ